MPAAVVFDFDGVLVDSVEIKTEAFMALYAEAGPEVVAKVVAYHRANGGVSRQRKIAHVERHILGRSVTSTRIEELSARFSHLVVERVVAAPAMPFATEVLQHFHGRLPLYVASGTPQNELREVIERRGLSGFFEGVYGSPVRKSAILRHIADSLEAEPSQLVFVGDASTDLEAAQEVGAAFVGYVPRQAEQDLGAVVISDLRELVDRVLPDGDVSVGLRAMPDVMSSARPRNEAPWNETA